MRDTDDDGSKSERVRVRVCSRLFGRARRSRTRRGSGQQRLGGATPPEEGWIAADPPDSGRRSPTGSPERSASPSPSLSLSLSFSETPKFIGGGENAIANGENNNKKINNNIIIKIK